MPINAKNLKKPKVAYNKPKLVKSGSDPNLKQRISSLDKTNFNKSHSSPYYNDRVVKEHRSFSHSKSTITQRFAANKAPAVELIGDDMIMEEDVRSVKSGDYLPSKAAQ